MNPLHIEVLKYIECFYLVHVIIIYESGLHIWTWQTGLGIHGAMETLWDVMETIQVECHGNIMKENRIEPYKSHLAVDMRIM